MDFQRFLSASLVMREATLPAPDLAEFFGDDPAEWTVRGLTAAELARCNEAAECGKDTQALVELLAKGDKSEAIRRLAGLPGKDVPVDIARRIQMLVEGSVSPKLSDDTRDVAVRLAETFPTLFYQLTGKILSLTGQGAEVGKRRPSGETQDSAT